MRYRFTLPPSAEIYLPWHTLDWSDVSWFREDDVESLKPWGIFLCVNANGLRAIYCSCTKPARVSGNALTWSVEPVPLCVRDPYELELRRWT